jgi:hypothetical protein
MNPRKESIIAYDSRSPSLTNRQHYRQGSKTRLQRSPMLMGSADESSLHSILHQTMKSD